MEKHVHKTITFDSFVRGGLTIAGILLAFIVISKLSTILLPFIIAWFLAYMLYPVVSFLQNKLRLHFRTLAILVTFLIIGIICWLIYLFIVPPMIDEFSRLQSIIAKHVAEGTRNALIPGTLEFNTAQWIADQKLDKYLTSENITNTIKQALPHVVDAAESTISIILGIIASGITLLYTIFILFDYENMARSWISFVPEKSRHFAITLANDLKHGMNSYFRGQAIVATLVGIVFAIGFIIIDFPIAIGLGILFGILNLVPYMQYLGFIPAVLLALLQSADTGNNFWGIMGQVIIVFIIAQIIQDLIFIPRIMGRAMGLKPAFILLALSVWGSLLGIIGMIIALPATTLIISYYKRYVIKENDDNKASKEDSNTN